MNLEGKSKRDIAQQVAGKNFKQAGYGLLRSAKDYVAYAERVTI